MKRTYPLIFLLLLLSAAALTGCGKGAGQAQLQEGKVNVVTSFYPLYDFAGKIGGDHANVINLVPAGVEPHDWSPKSNDIRLMTKAEMLVYQGAGFEGWVDDFLQSLPKDSKVKVVETSKSVELMKDQDEAHSGSEAHGHEGVDPHAWLSPANAKKMAGAIKDGFIQADPAHKADYEANFAELSKKFDALDASYRDSLSKVPRKEIVVSHDAFGYLCRDYGLTQKAIMGLSPDAEPTSQDMRAVKAFIKESGVKYIFFEELVSDKTAKTLAKDAGIQTLVLNPLEGLTEEEVKAGKDYFGVMETNLQNLLKALQ
ncbi:metal ABC transporter substrate-binding protein [Paenibacillus sp. CC-CFT747]|nr:metal ABC transporter substrate-binding protein [Paenibacillus sp. CC-CFT747]